MARTFILILCFLTNPTIGPCIFALYLTVTHFDFPGSVLLFWHWPTRAVILSVVLL